MDEGMPVPGEEPTEPGIPPSEEPQPDLTPPEPPEPPGPWWAPDSEHQADEVPTAWAADAHGTWTAEAPGAPAGPPPHRGRTVLAAALAGLVLLSAGVGIGWKLTRGGSPGSSRSSEPPLQAVPQTTPSTGQAVTGLSVQAIANRVDPAVVDITTSFNSAALGGGSSGGPGQPQAAGTGMVLTSSGEVLTNNHVVEGSTNINVTIQGRSGTYTAKVIGVDPTDDVALLQIQGVSGLPTVTLADSSQLTVGQEVVAIGNALGRGGSPTVTEGTISALNQSITVRNGGSGESLSGLIQFDAPISPGDSGGPLVNSSAQVVGIITAAASRADQRVSSQGYAISVNSALRIVNDIRAGRASGDIILGQCGFLGIQVRDLTPSLADQIGLNITSGALVVGVVPGTPASRAGLSQNAVITVIDGQRIDSASALGPAIHRHKPGNHIQVTWVDQSGTHTAMVRLVGGVTC